MKKIKLIFLFLFLSMAISFAQQKKYVSYTTKKGETIKSIAKVYKMSKRDLLRLNPGVRKKPKPNTVIIVPNKNFGKPDIEIIKNEVNLYEVQPKETLFGLSKKFGVTIEALKNANPILEDGLKVGMKLRIPKPMATIAKDSSNYVLHKVIRDDTVYNLAKRYEVTKEDLFNLNPMLKDGLKLGMLLKIKPIEIVDEDSINYVLHKVIKDDTVYNLAKRYEVIEEDLFNLNPTLKDGLKLGMLLKIKPIEIIDKEIDYFVENIDFEREINVVLMLPYQLNILSGSITTESFEKSNSLLNITTDFHLGSAMAIDSLRQKGLKINVTYLDTETTNYKLQLLVDKNDFSDTDVVIGPLYFDKAHWVSKRIKAPVIAPLYSNNQDLLSSKNLIKSSPDLKVYEDKLLAYMEKSYKGENIVVINDDKPENQSKLWRIVNKLKTFDSIQNIEVIKPENGFIEKKVFMKKLDTLSKNWVLLISDEIITTSATVNNLKTYAEDVDISLFALTKGRNFDNISNSFLGKLKFIFTSSEYLNMSDIKTQRFYEKYKSENYALPTKYAIRGFDVTYDALIRIASSDNLNDGLKAGISKRISSLFDYDKKLFESFENRGVFLIQYTKDLDAVNLE